MSTIQSFKCSVTLTFGLYSLLVTKKLADFLGAMRTNPDYIFCFSVGFFDLLGWIIFHFKTIHLCTSLRPDFFLSSDVVKAHADHRSSGFFW